jgi:hypothetical protein
MAITDRARTLAPYAAQLLYDEYVQDAARRALEAARESYRRARGDSPGEALTDEKLWRRTQEAVGQAAEFWAGLTAPPPKRKTRRWWTLAIVAAGVAVALAASPNAREAIWKRGPEHH